MIQHCFTDLFGMCIQSEAEARDMIIAWGVGSAIGLSLAIACIIGTVVGAKACLKFVQVAALLACFATGASLLVTYAVDISDHELERFIVAYGYQITMVLLAVSLTAWWFGKRLESTEPETSRRDAVVFGSVGSFLVIGCAFAAAVTSVWTEIFILSFISVLCIALTFLGVAWSSWAESRSHSPA